MKHKHEDYNMQGGNILNRSYETEIKDAIEIYEGKYNYDKFKPLGQKMFVVGNTRHYWIENENNTNIYSNDSNDITYKTGISQIFEKYIS